MIGRTHISWWYLSFFESSSYSIENHVGQHTSLKEKMTKGKRKQEKRKLSLFMCHRCHEVGHLANGCPNKEKLKKMKEKRASSKSSASSATLGVISPQCAQPSNW